MTLGSATSAGAPVLTIRDLEVRYGRAAPAVAGFDLTVDAGELVGLIGESGCGKSTVALSVLRLLPVSATVTAGQFDLCGESLPEMTARQLNTHRAKTASIIFQEPMTALNPCMRVGHQIAEVFRMKEKVTWKEAERRSIDLLERVEVPNAARRARQYPHELSGGMRQRVVIAMAMALSPALLIADEPTTALDVTVQAQILDLLREIHERAGMSVLLITHDLGVIAEMCTRVVVMYAGQIMERGPIADVLCTPLHPYTSALLAAMPRVDVDVDRELRGIPGWVSEEDRSESGCRFRGRCAFAELECAEPQALRPIGSSDVRCWKARGGWMDGASPPAAERVHA